MVEMALRVAGLILFALILAALAQLGRRVHPKAARLEDKEANAATSDGGSLWTNFPRLLRVMRWPRFMAGILALMSATGVIDLVIRLTA